MQHGASRSRRERILQSVSPKQLPVQQPQGDGASPFQGDLIFTTSGSPKATHCRTRAGDTNGGLGSSSLGLRVGEVHACGGGGKQLAGALPVCGAGGGRASPLLRQDLQAGAIASGVAINRGPNTLPPKAPFRSPPLLCAAECSGFDGVSPPGNRESSVEAPLEFGRIHESLDWRRNWRSASQLILEYHHGSRVQRTPPPPPKRSITADGCFSLLAFAFVVVLVLYPIADVILGSFTRSESAIGTVKSVSGASGRFRGLTVLETDTSFYVLQGYLNVQKGTSLTLQTRFNGDRYVCGWNAEVCVQTASTDLAGVESTQRSVSSPASAAEVGK